jgi:hypothetical protein
MRQRLQMQAGGHRAALPRLIPARWLAALYATIAGLWIWLSDRLLLYLLSDARQLALWQTYKGWGFVAATALLLFLERTACMPRSSSAPPISAAPSNSSR